MGDLASDRESAVSLIIDEYRRLQKHDSNHKLLQPIYNVTDSGFKYSKDEKILDEFLDKYAPNNSTSVAVMLARYFVDLRKAVDKIEGIDRSPKIPQQSLTKPQKYSTIEEKVERLDLPF